MYILAGKKRLAEVQRKGTGPRCSEKAQRSGLPEPTPRRYNDLDRPVQRALKRSCTIWS